MKQGRADILSSVRAKDDGQWGAKERKLKVQIDYLKVPDSPTGVPKTWGAEKKNSRLKLTPPPFYWLN